MTFDNPHQYRMGVAYAAASALAWSTSGLFVRLISADLMTILFWRGIVSGLSVFLIFLYFERGRALAILRRMRTPSFLATLLSAASMVTGIGSIYYASVADAMVIYATVPFMTAAVAYLAIGERPSGVTLVASAVAIVGVLVMLQWDGEQGHGSTIGKVLALLMTVSVAGLATVMRKYRTVPMLPAMAFSAWLCSFATFWFADPMSVSVTDVNLIITFGIVQNAMGLVLYTAASTRIPASDASLLTALEVPLTPLWVWMLIGEMPSTGALIGGPIVLAALFGHILFEYRRSHSHEAEAGPA